MGCSRSSGSSPLIGSTDEWGDLTRSEQWLNLGIGCLLTLVGVGLCLSERWAWPPAVAIAVASVGLGLYVMAQPGDITSPGAPIVAVVVLIAPGLLLLSALVTPRSIEWFRRR